MMRHYDIFCDASIDTKAKVACGGATIIDRTSGLINTYYQVVYNATNNMGEIIAIYTGIYNAVLISEENMRNGIKSTFHVFSDSGLCISGLNEWIFSWILNQTDDWCMMNSSGKPVANQQWFVQIYNMICDNKLNVRFFNNRGHIENKNKYQIARDYFIKTNHVTPEQLNTTIEEISFYNCYIDKYTRDIVKQNVEERSYVGYQDPTCIFVFHADPGRKYLYHSLIS